MAVNLQSHNQGEARNAPNALDAERSILSTCLQNPERLPDLVNHGISEDHFYLPANREVFKLLLEMRAKDKPIDLVTMHQKLTDENKIDSIGGPAALVDLSNAAPSEAHFSYYVEIVKEKYGLRKMIQISNSVIERAYGNEDYSSISSSFRKEVQESDSKAMPLLETSFSDTLKEWGQKFAEKIKNPSSVMGYDCGLPKLNGFLRGIRMQEFMIIAGKPSAGKTGLMLQFAGEIAAQRAPVLIFSFEMHEHPLIDRWCSFVTKIDIEVIIDPKKATEEEKEKVRKFMRGFNKLNITIKKGECREISRLIAYAQKWIVANPSGVIFVDYIQLVKDPSAKGKVEEIGNVTAELSALRLRMDCAIISGSQLNKDGIVKGNESIWEDASQLIRLVQDVKTSKVKAIHLKKNRNGKDEQFIPAYFDKPRQRFVEIEE